jgi:hypothetical protein
VVTVSSINWLPDETFEFRATLLVAVPQPGPARLEQGAEVNGTGAINQSQVSSIAVTEIMLGGAHYRLKTGDGAMKAQTPGAHGTVDFYRSQILEMWPSAVAVYEQASAPTGPPEPEK